MSQTISFPERCLTLRPPWPQAIACAGKRLENRGRGVASQLSGYRRLIGLSQSIGFGSRPAIDAEEDALDAEHQGGLRTGGLGRREAWMRRAGNLWLVAEVVDVREPWQCADDPWHIEGQHGIILGKVYEVKPVPCMGGLGAWRPQWCAACKKIVADSHGLMCKTCLSALKCGLDMPALEIVREYET